MRRLRPSRLIIIFALCCVPALASAAGAGDRSAHGRVVDPDGRPAAGITVVLRSEAGRMRQVSTSPDGTFTFSDVDPGRYDIVVAAAGFRADPVAFVAAAGTPEDLVVRLRVSGVSESILVSAGYVDTPLSEAPGSATTLRGSDLAARQLTSLGSALQLVPGFAIAPTGGTGAITSLFPRGGGSDYTLVLADGIRLNSMGGGIDLGHLTATGLDQIEVVRGPQSAVFGADAIGGVIHLRSKVGGRPSVGGEFDTGSYGTTRVALNSSGSQGVFQWGARAEHATSRGWTDVAPGTNEYVTNDDDRADTVALSAAVAPSSQATLRADARFGTNDRGYPGPFGSNPVGAYTGVDRVSRGRNTDLAGAVAYTQAWGAATTLRVQATVGDFKSKFASPWGDSTARTRRWTAHAQFDRALARGVAATVGADVSGERGESTYITGTAGQPIAVSRNDAAAFAEVRIRAGSRLFVTAGLRADQLSRAALEADPMAWEPRPAMAAERTVSLNPRLAASYYLATSNATGGNWTRVHGTAGSGIRPPGALEVAFTNNPRLKPERNRSADLGIEKALAGGLVVLDATGFINRYDDLIVAVGRSLIDYSQYRTDNISNARARGIETSLALRTKFGLEVRAAYTWLDTAILAVDRSGGVAPPPFAVGDRLLRRPRHQGSLDVVWTRGAVTAFARAGARSSVLDVEPSWGASGGLFTARGFTVVTAGASVRIAGRASIVARIDNLLDRKYEAVFGYPAPRRSFTIGVRVAAGQ